MDRYIAGLIDAEEFQYSSRYYNWNSGSPNVISPDKTALYNDGIRNQERIVLPFPIFTMSFEDIWGYRKTPAEPKIRDAQQYYRIVETDDGKWFSDGKMFSLHVSLISLYKIPLERVSKGLIYENGDIIDEGEQSLAFYVKTVSFNELSQVHIISCIWAYQNGFEDKIFHGWEGYYGLYTTYDYQDDATIWWDSSHHRIGRGFDFMGGEHKFSGWRIG